MDRDRQAKAYRSSGRMARDRMGADQPLEADALKQIRASDVVVVRGGYDHVERVLEGLEMPHTSIAPGQLPQVELSPQQLLVVNCPGNIRDRDVSRIAEFVAAGGSLFTTDWALRHVVEPAFPGVVAYNERPTADDVVRIEIKDHDNPFLAGVMDGADDPQWWLEASSYPIRIVDHDRVKVLLASRELESKYGEAPVAIVFEHGKGEVFHMISHYYLQRTELRTDRHKMAAGAYWAEKGMDVPAAVSADVADLSLGEVESAASSARLFANVAARKKMRNADKSRS
jgi:hypothetical protein